MTTQGKPTSERFDEKVKELLLQGMALIFMFGIFYVAPLTAFDWGRCDLEKTVEVLGGCSFFGKCGVGYTDQSFGTASRPVVGQKVCVQRSYFILDEKSFPLVAWRAYIQMGRKSELPSSTHTPTFEEWKKAKKLMDHDTSR